MYHKVIEMFGARVNWLLDAEAPSSTIESIITTFGRGAPVVDTLMLIYPHTAREKVAREFLDTKKKLLPPVAPAYCGRTKRITEFGELVAHFEARVSKDELERNKRRDVGIREILYDHQVHQSDIYTQARLRLFIEFLYGYVAYPHAFEIKRKNPIQDEFGVALIGWAQVMMFADPAGPSVVLYDGPL